MRSNRWKRLGIAAVVEQGLFTGSNFVLSLLLARWLIPIDYGAFAIALTVVLFLRTGHTALIVEPALVFAPEADGGGTRRALGRVAITHVWLVVALAGIGVLVGEAVRQAISVELGRAILVASLAIPPTFSLVYLRYAYYAVFKPDKAVVASAVYMVALLGGLAVLRDRSAVTVESAFLLQAAASCVAFLPALIMGLPVEWPRARHGAIAAETLRKHLPFSRWLWGSLVTSWVSAEIWYLILPPFAGIASSGVLRAHMNLLKPVDQISIALTSMLLPAFSRLHSREERDALLSRLILPTSLCSLAAALGAVLLGGPAMELAYGGQYDPVYPLILLVGLLSIALPLGRLYAVRIKASGRTRALFGADLAAAAIALATGILLIPRFGLAGLSAAMSVTYVSWVALCRTASRRVSAADDRATERMP